MTIWENKQNIGLWGFGQEGRAAYIFLREKLPNAQFTVLLDSDAVGDFPASLKILEEEQAEQALTAGKFDLVIKSPGISLYRPEIQQAKNRGTLFTSATNLWFEKYANAQTLVVTGTKGKSTTASLLYHLLKEAGISCTLSGNIGTPLLGMVPHGLNIIELSSYQIADLQHAPDMVLFTNLFPEHAPWHQGHDNYYRDKTRIAHLSEQTTVFANQDNAKLKELLANVPHVTWYQKSVSGLDIPQHTQYALGGIEAILHKLDYPIEQFLPHVLTFPSLPHRLEEIGTTPNGILCVNDSISTIPEATLAALDVYKHKPIMLILGGESRGQDYEKLEKTLSQLMIRHIFVLPDMSEKYSALLKKIAPLSRYTTLKDAVTRALSTGKEGDVLLLSPSAPSYNQFQNFEERGDAFNKLCGF